MSTTITDTTITDTTITDNADTVDTTARDGDAMESQIGAFAQRVATSAIGSFELATIELGMRLGLYDALVAGPVTPPELAARAGIDARYAREWLEQQATAGIVRTVSSSADGDADRRLFELPEPHQACLLDPDSLACVAPLATFAVAGAGILPQLVEAYRDGTGLSFAAYGEWIRRAQAAGNRPSFTNLLADEWLPAMPDVVARLRSGEARVADIGCGCGWASIALARGFDDAIVDGFDSDRASIEDARANAREAGVSDRVTFSTADATSAGGRYDLVCCFEALHDMAHPVEVLSTMRSMAAPDGTVFIVDERAADALTDDDPDPMQRFFYAASVLHCLPVGRSQEGSAQTGTVMRTRTLEEYASAAGYSAVEVLDVDHDMFRLYRLHA